MKTGSGSRDASPLRHSHVRADDVTVECGSSSAVEAHEIVERGRTRNMVSKFEVGSKVNVCGPGSRSFANTHVENKQKVTTVDTAFELNGNKRRRKRRQFSPLLATNLINFPSPNKRGF